MIWSDKVICPFYSDLSKQILEIEDKRRKYFPAPSTESNHPFMDGKPVGIQHHAPSVRSTAQNVSNKLFRDLLLLFKFQYIFDLAFFNQC